MQDFDRHILVTRKIPQPGLEILRESGAHVTVCQGDEAKTLTEEEVLKGVQSCDVVVSLLTETLSRQVLAINKRLLGVANFAVGYNNIDIEAATELGIPISNTPGVLTDTSADATWAMILAVARSIPQAHHYTAAGHFKTWGPNLFLGNDVSPGGSGRRKVLGIVGYGRIGQAVAKRSIGFDMEVLAHGPSRGKDRPDDGLATWVDLPELLAKSDFVTLHPPLTPETHHLIGKDELQAMKPTAYLINAARGPVVDEKVLVEALRHRWIAGAALDVYEQEPLLAPGLAELPNVVLLPHIASASIDTREKMATMAATNAVAHLRRERAPHCVNPQVYDTDAYRRRVDRQTCQTRRESPAPP